MQVVKVIVVAGATELEQKVNELTRQGWRCQQVQGMGADAVWDGGFMAWLSREVSAFDRSKDGWYKPGLGQGSPAMYYPGPEALLTPETPETEEAVGQDD